MAEYSNIRSITPPDSQCACSSLSTAFMRFKQDNENIRADIAEIKSRTLPRHSSISSVTSLSDILEAPERWSSQLSLPTIERKLDQLTTLLEGVAIDVKSQRECCRSRDVPRHPQHSSWNCPGCGLQYRVEEDNSTLRPTPSATLTSTRTDTDRPAFLENVEEAIVDQVETMAMSRRSGTPSRENTDTEGDDEQEVPCPVGTEGENNEREETESASAETTMEDLQAQIRQGSIRIHELQMKTSELLRMNYTWQEYFQMMTGRMDDERFLWRLQLGELDRNVDSGPILAQLHERIGVMERERLESIGKINALTATVRESEERLRLSLEEIESLRTIASVPPDPQPCDNCARLTSDLADSRERCSWLSEKLSSAEERYLQMSQKHEEMLSRSDALLAESEGLREQLNGTDAELEKSIRKVAQLQAECESMRLAQAAMEARREGDTSPTQLSQLGHMQTISAWNCPSCNCKNPPFTPMCHKCHRGQRPPPFNPYVLDRS